MNSNLKNKAYDILKRRLIYCEYEPGSILKESELAVELGISRTPIREAISLLENEGYLIVAPKKGIFITDITLNDVIQIFQVRMVIEPVALKMAGPNLGIDDLMSWKNKFNLPSQELKNSFELDFQMHLFLIEHCKNKYIIDMMKTVFDKNARIVISSNNNIAHVTDAKAEHIDILDTLIKQDFDLASELMRNHISNCRKAAIDFYYSS